jgi:hypothetical protein
MQLTIISLWPELPQLQTQRAVQGGPACNMSNSRLCEWERSSGAKYSQGTITRHQILKGNNHWAKNTQSEQSLGAK